jgi:hypothetical protein
MSENLFSMLLSSEERALINARRLEAGPALPTKPYTVIKVQWRDESDETNPVLMCFPPEWYGEWGWSDGDDYGDAEHLRREIVGFRVLAEPVEDEPETAPLPKQKPRVRALPTAAHSAIRVDWSEASGEKDGGERDYWVGEDGLWRPRGTGIGPLTAADVHKNIEGFQLLAEAIVPSEPRDTGMSHESFAQTYPNEVQYHYDGGFLDGVRETLKRWNEIAGGEGESTREQVAHELGVDL